MAVATNVSDRVSLIFETVSKPVQYKADLKKRMRGI